MVYILQEYIICGPAFILFAIHNEELKKKKKKSFTTTRIYRLGNKY